MAKKVVLAGACRTAIGKMGGALSPAVFRPLNDESFLYLLLPLRG